MRTAIAGLVVPLLLVLPNALLAQLAVDRESVLLSPSSTGAQFADVVVRNTSAGEVEASVGMQDWDVDANGRSHWRATGRVAGRCGTRVTVSPQRTVRITLKDGATFDAECWSAAVVQPTRMAARPFSTERTEMRRATVPLYVTPDGLIADGEVRRLYVSGDSLVVDFANRGPVRADVTGRIEVRSPTHPGLLVIPLPRATLLAGATRTLRIAMPELRTGEYSLTGIMDFGGTSPATASTSLEIR